MAKPEVWSGERFANPWREMIKLQDRVNRMFDTFTNPMTLAESAVATDQFSPSCNVIEEDSRYVMKFDLPGIKKEDVDVSLDGQVLTVTAERKEEKRKDDARSCLCEVNYGSYSRSFTLPETVAEKQVDAKFEDGVLTVMVPKMIPSKTKHISIH